MDRMSVRWGLKGRADAILRREDSATILELKSGKVPVDDHVLQLCAYSLIFSEDSSRNPDGYILYSATGKAARLKELENEKKNLVLSGRNRVLFLKHSYTVSPRASGDLACGRNGKCFSRFHCNRLFGNAAEAFFPNESERRYYDRWFRVLSTDAWAQEAEFARILDAATLKDRVSEGMTLEIQEMRSPARVNSENGISHQDDNSSGEDPFPDATQSGSLLKELVLSESSADLMPGEEIIVHRGDPCAPEAFRCRVKECADEKMTVRVRIPICWNNRRDFGEWGNCFTKKSSGWFLDRIPFSRGREVARHALFSFFDKADKRVIASVVHDGSEEIKPESKQTKIHKNKDQTRVDVQHGNFIPTEEIPWSLNERQETAVREALGCQTFHLVHGPPGTGKTRVLARLIRVCLDRGERVLVACPTNVALDRLLMALIDLGVRNFVRIGGRSNVSKEFVRALELTHNTAALFQELASKEHDFKTFKRRVAETQLVGATAYQCTAHPVFLRQRFDRVVVDEAGQLDEPSTLGPISMASKFVLGGDHLQLPPVVKVQNPDRASEGALLECSLFERLFNSVDPQRISALEVQYRMNAEIQDIPSRLFYKGLLKPSQEAAVRRLKLDLTNSRDPDVNKIIDPELPVVFVDVDGVQNTKAHPEEAEIACRITESLVKSGVAPQEIGIITPYRAQQSLIRRRLASGGSHISSLSADTVDSFQGGEREVIILSLARSDNVTTFLADKKRLNVSLSRARSKLILLGHGPVLQEHPLFAELLQGLERVKM
jgi:DNA replication ATP-dependent helicase Dna2